MPDDAHKTTIGRVTFGPLGGVAPHPDLRAMMQGVAVQVSNVHACNCIGPQPGQTKCPCALRVESEKGAAMVRDGVTINGRRYRLVPED